MPDTRDLDINRNLRKVFIRHWIDLGRVFFRSVNGAVTVRGALERIAGVSELLSPTIVETIFMELNRVPDVKRITASLDNWKQEAGVWQRVAASAGRSLEGLSRGGTFQITDAGGVQRQT